MITIDVSLNNRQFQRFQQALQANYPEWHYQQNGIPLSHVQVAKNDSQVVIRPLGKYQMATGVEQVARRILADVTADKTLEVDDEPYWLRPARKTLESIQAKRYRQRKVGEIVIGL